MKPLQSPSEARWSFRIFQKASECFRIGAAAEPPTRFHLLKTTQTYSSPGAQKACYAGIDNEWFMFTMNLFQLPKRIIGTHLISRYLIQADILSFAPGCHLLSHSELRISLIPLARRWLSEVLVMRRKCLPSRSRAVLWSDALWTRIYTDSHGNTRLLSPSEVLVMGC